MQPNKQPFVRRFALSICCSALACCSEIRAAREQDAALDDAGREREDEGYRACGSFALVGAPDNATPIIPPVVLTALDARTGIALDPSLTTTTVGGSQWCLDVPGGDGALDLHFHPIMAEHLLDTVLLGMRADSAPEPLLRLYYADYFALHAKLAEYTQRADRAPLMGNVLALREGTPVAVVGCATVQIDDQPHPSEEYAQRYIDAKGLEALPSQLTQTGTERGAFMFGNLSKGRHTLKVSLDRGKTFVAETSIYIGLAPADVETPSMGVVYQLVLGLEGEQTPPGCEQL